MDISRLDLYSEGFKLSGGAITILCFALSDEALEARSVCFLLVFHLLRDDYQEVITYRSKPNIWVISD